MKIFFSLLLSFVSVCTAAAQEYPLKPEKIWCREDGKAVMNVHEKGAHIESLTSKDWAVPLCEYIAVEPGDTFLFSGTVRNLKGTGRVSIAAALFDGDKIIDWNHGVSTATATGEKNEQFLETEFIVPAGTNYKILPRLVGQGEATFDVSGFQLHKTGKTVLGTRVIDLPGGEGERFVHPIEAESLSEHWLVRSGGGKAPVLSVDKNLTFNGHGTLWVSGDEKRRTTLFPRAAFRAKAGARYTVSLQVKLQTGKVSLELLPWKDGLAAGSRIAVGTFSPSIQEEAEDWSDIHIYFTVPENAERTQTFVPMIYAEPGTTFRIGELSLTVPRADEVKQTGKKVDGWATERIEETFDRALVAVPVKDGIYLSWRLLKTDTPQTGFDVFRIKPDGSEEKLNTEPLTRTTDFLYKTTGTEQNVLFQVRAVGSVPVSESAQIAALDKPYISIPLKDAQSFMRIAFNDLDGDGTLDYVIKTPNGNVDPYLNYWSKSPETYKLQVYRSDGSFFWQYELGWGIERGIWYSPCLVADLDGDGCAEVAVKTADGDFRNSTGRVYSGKEFISILDGKTGKLRTKIECPERNGLGYNLSNRHQLCLAYLDGKTPCLLVLRGTYSRMTAVAYQFRSNNKLEELWRFDNRWQQEHFGQGAHTTHAVDLDGDGRDEVILGSIVLDDDGTVLWGTKLGHPDNVYVGDLEPEHPGLEILYGIERRQPKNGVCMVDAQTGTILWGLEQPTQHIHSQGMCSDIDPRFPGYESWQGERDSEEERWLRTAKGDVIELPKWFPRKGLVPQTVWRDADVHRELIIGGRFVKFPSNEPVEDTKIEGSIRLIADVCGDWREEVVTSYNGEIRIYPAVVPATDRRVTFLQDPNYRATLTESSMGYPQIPVPSHTLP